MTDSTEDPDLPVDGPEERRVDGNQLVGGQQRVELDLGAGFDLADLLGAPHGILVERELVFSNDGTTVFVAHVRHHVHVRGPELELTLPIDDGRKRGGDQKRTW